MFETLAQGASHPAVAAWLGLGTAAVAAVVVAMAWSVNARQIRLAELMARRQFPVISGNGAANKDAAEIEDAAARRKRRGPAAGGRAPCDRQALPPRTPTQRRRGRRGGRGSKVPPEVIEGPDEVVTGEQARFRVQPSGPHQVVSWAVGGGAVSHAPDPAHPGDLLLLADQPGDLTIIARVREGLTERRATKTVTAVAEVARAGRRSRCGCSCTGGGWSWSPC